MKTLRLLMTLLPALALFGGPARAQKNISPAGEGPWLVRLRIIGLNTADQSAPFSAAGVNFPANAVHVSSKIIPEVDGTYFITRHWATELVLTYPQDHGVSVAGLGNIGQIHHLPPVLTLQYHQQIPKTRFKPYVGLGFNFTWITDSNLTTAGIPLDVTRTSIGFAYQVGIDYDLGKHFSLNFDYKHVNLNPDVKIRATGAKLANAEIDPDLIGLGVGYHF